MPPDPKHEHGPRHEHGPKHEHSPKHPPLPGQGPRRPGRPPSVGADTPLNVKISQADLAVLDDCADRRNISRAEAVRQSIDLLRDAVQGDRPPALSILNVPPSGERASLPQAGKPTPDLKRLADSLYADLPLASDSVRRDELEVLLRAILLATDQPLAGLCFLDCLRLHALATEGELASRAVAARFAGLIQARGTPFQPEEAYQREE